MDILGITGVAAIAVICYFVGMGLKAWDTFDDRKIPVMMCACGGIIGVVAYYFATSLIPATDPFTALAIGIVSGAMATTINQIWKQSQKEE